MEKNKNKKNMLLTMHMMLVIVGTFLLVQNVKADYPAILNPISATGTTGVANADTSLFASGNQICLLGTVANKSNVKVGCITLDGTTATGTTGIANIDASLSASGNQICLLGTVANRSNVKVGCITLDGATATGTTGVANIDASLSASGNQICLLGIVANRSNVKVGCITLTPTTYHCNGNDTLSGTTCIVQNVNTQPGACAVSKNYLNFVDPPTAPLCDSGTASALRYVQSNGTTGDWGWTWTCTADNTASCFAYKSISGSCGSSNGQYLSIAPSGSSLCASGSASPIYGSGPWSWFCYGIHGNTVSCQALKVGSCGSDNGQYILSTSSPTNLCSDGSRPVITDTGSGWSWTCNSTDCSATKKYSCGRCSNNNSYAWAAFESSDPGCSGPLPNTAATYSLNCSCGTKTSDPFGYTASCAAPVTCGSDNNQNLYSIPTNFCSTGSYSNLTATATGWAWTCGGASCSANKIADCNRCSNVYSFARATFQSIDNCANPIFGTSVNYSSDCSCGSKTVDFLNYTQVCTAPTNGQCGSSNGKTVTSRPTTGLCSSGTLNQFSTTTSGWTWKCLGINGGTDATNCFAQKPASFDGACGASNGQSFSTQPTTNLCSMGSPSAVSTIGTQWQWTCGGINGGKAANCSAQNNSPSWSEIAP